MRCQPGKCVSSSSPVMEGRRGTEQGESTGRSIHCGRLTGERAVAATLMNEVVLCRISVT